MIIREQTISRKSDRSHVVLWAKELTRKVVFLRPLGLRLPRDRLFPDDHVELPGYGGDFYKDYYGSV